MHVKRCWMNSLVSHKLKHVLCCSLSLFSSVSVNKCFSARFFHIVSVELNAAYWSILLLWQKRKFSGWIWQSLWVSYSKNMNKFASKSDEFYPLSSGWRWCCFHTKHIDFPKKLKIKAKKANCDYFYSFNKRQFPMVCINHLKIWLLGNFSLSNRTKYYKYWE